MSEFKKELKGLLKGNNKCYQGITTGNVVALQEHFKNWQPPKELVEVPQFVADWFENNEDDLSFKIWGYLINWKLQDKKSDFFKWIKNEPECIEILIRMQDGYTVKKEQLYHLKNKNTGNILYKQPIEAGGNLIEVVATFNNDRIRFSQEEIDTMELGSYEILEVDE